MAVPFPTVSNSLGSWMISSWISVFLCSIEGIFVYRYFQTYKRDHWLLRAGVAVTFLAGSATVISSCAGVYRVSISDFGNTFQAVMPTVEMCIIPLGSGIASLVGQTYLIRRYQKVSKNWSLALILEILAVLAFALLLWGFVCLVKLAQGDLLTPYVRLAPKIVYAMNAGVDILVSVALIIFLVQLRDTEVATTRRLVTRLILVAFESGAVTSMLALGTLLAYVLEPHTQISVPFSAATGFSQALCLLYNLNLRRVDGESGSISSNPTSVYPMSKMGRSAFARSGTHAAGISVHQETVMHEDDERLTADEEKKMPVVASIPHISYSA